jgi:multiple sugar transport system substrate-binding protein
MYISGPWYIGDFKSRLPAAVQDKWSTAPLPGPTGDSSGVSLAGGSSLVIFRASPHKAASWRLIEFLSRPEQQARFYRLTGDLPARTEAWRDTSLADNKYARAFGEQLRRVAPLPKVPEAELIVTRVLDAADRAIRGGVSVPRALADLDREVDAALEKRRWMLARSP